MKAMLLGFVALAGCSQQSVPVDNAVDLDPSPVPENRNTGDVLPAGMTGRWAVTPDQCAAGSELGITVEPIRIRFFEARAEITRATALSDGTYRVDAQLTGEGETRSHRFDLTLSNDGQRLRRVEAPIPDITYTRCKG